MSAKTFTIVMAVLAVIGLLAYGLLSKGEQALAIGEPAPDKELTVLGGSETRSLEDFRGRFVLVNFWASWCEPCRQEAPALEDFQSEHGGPGFTVLGIDLDDASDDALAFVREYGLTYPQLRDGDGRERREAYGMTGFPESFLVDPDGEIALIRRGPVDAEFLREEVAPLIEGSSK
ncbi:MAG TPA: TlpA disulfide reductase family protein [Solirubrobacterales bacterium]|nr:TlpA disulfide reductase family protein [Solirubrobacterales bacterium]